jgi:hypothetical protein
MRTRTLLALALGAAAVFAAAGAGEQSGPVAIVYDLSTNARATETRSQRLLKPFDWLKEGDEVRADLGQRGGAEPVIAINFDDGAVESFRLQPTTIVRIRSRIQRRSLGAAWIDYVAAWLGGGDARRATAVTRGDNKMLAFRIPGLQSGAARVAGGPRQLQIGWMGGTPPYRISLRAVPSGHELFHAATQTNRAPPTPVITLSPGARYEWYVQDAYSTRSARFTAVDQSQLPTVPTNDFPPWVSSDIKDTLRAMQLAHLDQNQLSYEAWLSVMPLASRYPPAEKVATLLQAGDVP